MEHLDCDRVSTGTVAPAPAEATGPSPTSFSGLANRAALEALDATLRAAEDHDLCRAASAAQLLADEATAAAEHAQAIATLDALLALATGRSGSATHTASLSGFDNN